MQQTAKRIISTAFTLAALTGVAATAGISTAVAADKAASVIEQGKAISVDRKKGNCLACHIMDDGTLRGNIAPPLVSMKLRYPDKTKLRTQIWDPTVANPNTIMPPFGKHRILSEDEVDKVVEYIYTL